MKNLYPKKLAFLLFLSLTLIATTSQAKNYYVSNTGNDANDGLTATTSWQTITRVNTFLKTILAGDVVLFKCGNTFYGSLVIARSGTASLPIVFGAYGTGAKPVITGFTTASGWTNVGTNLWQSTALGNTNKPNMVTINNAVAQVGRYPNYGYRTYTAHNGNLSITDPTLSSSINWTGATAHIRELHDQISSDPITNHSGTTISYTNTNGYTPQDGYGYFISHSLKAVDTVNEWYFDPATKKITVYSLSAPASVRVATKDTLLLVGQSDYITIDGISFEGANVDAVSFGGPKLGQAINTSIKNCNFNFSGNNAIYGTYDIGCLIDNNTINNSLNNAIELENEGGQSTDAVITNNTIKNTGLFAGMGVKYNAIVVWGPNALIQYNNIDSVGLTGVSFYYNNVRVLNNVINHFCRTVDDAGAINVFDPSFGATIETGREIKNNIILNGTYAVGAGTSDKGDAVDGIYIDDKSNGILVEGNSVSGVPRAGFYIHNGTDIIFRNNTLYNAGDAQALLVHDNHAINMPIRNIVFKNNILFGNQGTQMIQTIRTIRNDIDTMFTVLDSNIYARPILSTGTIINTIKYYGITNQKNNYTLPTWKTAIYDVHTSYFTRTVSSANDVRFEYNGDKSPKTITLDAKYIDVRNTTYNGSITLNPYTSAVLVKAGELALNKIPVANAGADKIITLPVNNTTLSGSGTDQDGTINSYVWTKISGPTAGLITTAAAATTDINSLVQGVYKFELTVTDNSKATGKDTVQVIVNAAPNQVPLANAGTDITITLPVNTVTLTGRGDDADGTISNYSWVKISGPISGTIANVNAATTVLSNLTEGVYQFELTVTDNKGAVGKDLVQITVNAAENQLPVSNAGTDNAITLPVNTVALTGRGDDADGTISNYSWVKISGPISGTIANVNAATAVLSNLTEGVYQFELTVTDNKGGVGKDLVQITVNAAQNQLPVSNAGTDDAITLPLNMVTLTGSGTDTDGTISSYSWIKVSGPESGTIETGNAANTVVSNLSEGLYQFELTVTDNNGATGKSMVQVIVNAAENQLPLSNAGTDNAITLPLNMVTLSGSGTDTDGTISSYSWIKISGPESGTIETGNAANTVVSNLSEGLYQFELTVTDNNGATGKSMVQLTVNVAANVAPTANAGADIEIKLPASSVALTGSGADSDGTISTYTWAKISGPLSGTIDTYNASTIVLSDLSEGVYQFELTITDNNGAIAKDIVQVTVAAAANLSPTANAGTDQVITLPVSDISLTGSGTDADGMVAGYSWKKISGPSNGTIVSGDLATTVVSNLSEGTYQFELTITDNAGEISKDTVQVTVNAAANKFPVANAGSDKTITLPINTVTLTGNGTDVDGTISSYSWIKKSGPSAGTISSATATTSLSNLVQGIYEYELTVTDNNGATASSTLKITVNAAPTTALVANAGTDKVVTLPTNTITLSGSGKVAGGTISSYNWSKLPGLFAKVESVNTATTSVTGLTQGIYKFQLTVTDSKGVKAKDTITVTVNAAPVANAGVDKVITLPVNTVTLAGSGKVAGGTISSYNWSKLPGLFAKVESINTAATSVTGLTQGIYKFQLTVTDNNGVKVKDTVTVTVNAAPIANAGVDKVITLPVNTVTLAGSGKVAGGTISSYNWSKLPGLFAKVESVNTATTSVTGLTQGIYKFQLTVTDNNGVKAKDTVTVTVHAAPVANAGVDKVITLPVNTVTLAGSGKVAGGTISSYNWSKLPGLFAKVESINTATTSVTSLTQGIYKFQLTVTDNNGVKVKDTVTVTVNAAPVANAGVDKIITLPVNTVTLTGSGKVASGTIGSYNWSKLPGLFAKVESVNTATTSVTGLTQGIYKFQLTVTDNNGVKAKDTVTVTVNAAPVANAGVDKIITLPVNTVTLTGSGKVPGGTISSYNWSKLPGLFAKVESVNTATTSVTGLTQGVYKFQLTVTDNNGVKAKDTVTVTVNSTLSRETETNILIEKNQLIVIVDTPSVAKDTIQVTGKNPAKIDIPVITNMLPAVVQPKNALKVYPNPVRDITNLDITTSENKSIAIVVVDMSGRIVKTDNLANPDKIKNFKLDMTSLRDGYYIITARFGSGQMLISKVLKYGGK